MDYSTLDGAVPHVGSTAIPLLVLVDAFEQMAFFIAHPVDSYFVVKLNLSLLIIIHGYIEDIPLCLV